MIYPVSFIPFSELGVEVALSRFPVALLRKREDAGQEDSGAKIPNGLLGVGRAVAPAQPPL